MPKRTRANDSSGEGGHQSKILKALDTLSRHSASDKPSLERHDYLPATKSTVDEEATCHTPSLSTTLQDAEEGHDARDDPGDATLHSISPAEAVTDNKPSEDNVAGQGVNVVMENTSIATGVSHSELDGSEGNHPADGREGYDTDRAPLHLAPDDIFTHVVGSNPFSSNFPSNKTVLKGGLAVSTWMAGDGDLDFTIVPVANVVELCRPTHALRLLKCAAHPDATTLIIPRGGIVNVALREPSTLSVNPSTGYLRSQENSSWIVASLTGQTTYYANSGIRQICVTPFAHGWHRFVAVLARVFQQPALYFQSFKGGVTFGTSRFKGGNEAKRKPRQYIAPIDGPTLKEGDTIPVYDGREQVRLGNYWEKPYLGEVRKDSSVMMLFSVKKGALPKAVQAREDVPRGLNTAVYLNVLAIIVLAEPGEPFSETESGEGPEAFGVHSVESDLPECEVIERVKKEDPCL